MSHTPEAIAFVADPRLSVDPLPSDPNDFPGAPTWDDGEEKLSEKLRKQAAALNAQARLLYGQVPDLYRLADQVEELERSTSAAAQELAAATLAALDLLQERFQQLAGTTKGNRCE